MSIDSLIVTATLLGDDSDEGDVREIGLNYYRFELSYSGDVSIAQRTRAIQEVEDSLRMQSAGGVYPEFTSSKYALANLPREIIPDYPVAYVTNTEDAHRLAEEMQ